MAEAVRELTGDFVKFDVSGLSNKADFLPRSVQEMAFLGSDFESFQRRQIIAVGERLYTEGVLDSNTGERETRGADILHRAFSVYSLAELRQKQNDPNLAPYVRENLKLHEIRLAKSVYAAFKKMGVSDDDLVDPRVIEERLPDCLKGIGEKVSGLLIRNESIKEALGKVNVYRNETKYSDYDEKKKDILGEIGKAKQEIKKVLSTKDKSQAELALSYLCSFEVEVSGNYEKEGIVDAVVDYLNNHVLRSDVTVDKDLNLIGSHTEVLVDSLTGRTRTIQVVNHDFDKKEGNWTPDDYANYRNYENPETVRWLREREQKASDLIMTLTGGAFTSVVEIREKMNEGGPMNHFYTANDGTRQPKADLEGIIDNLGLFVCEAIKDAGGANVEILGTLNIHRVDRLLPRVMADDVYLDAEDNPIEVRGLSDSVVVNMVRDSFLREQLMSICEIDRTRNLLSTDGGWSSVENKKDLIADIKRIVDKITTDKRMGLSKKYTSEARRIQKWLLERVDRYNELLKRQIIIGHGEIFPSGEGEEAKEARLTKVRELLDYIEDAGSPIGSLDIMNESTMLFEISRSDKVEDDIKDEIHARLALIQTYHHMHQAGGLLDNRGQCVEDAIELAWKEGLILDRKALAFFLKKGANGLPVADSLNRLQKLNSGHAYHDTLTGMMGMTGNIVDGRKGEAVYSYGKIVPGSDAGEFLLSVRENGINFLLGTSSNFIGKSPEELKVIKEQLMNDSSYYLDSWTRDVRREFLGLSNKIQTPQSRLWGQKTFEVGTDTDGNPIMMEPMYCNYVVDKDSVRKEMVRDFILEKNSKARSEDFRDKGVKGNARRGWTLAWRLMEAMGETSVFNALFDGHDELAALLLGEDKTAYNEERKETTGARAVTGEFGTFFTTPLRYWSGEGQFDRRSVFGPISSEGVNLSKMDLPKQDLRDLLAVVLPKKIEKLHQFARKEDIAAKDFVSNELWKTLAGCAIRVARYGQDVLVGKDGLPLRIFAKNEEDARVRGLTKTSRDIFEDDLIEEIPKILAKGVLKLGSTRPELGVKYGDYYSLGEILTTKFAREEVWGGKDKKWQIFSEEEWRSLFGSDVYKADMINTLRDRYVAQIYNDLEKSRDLGIKIA